MLRGAVSKHIVSCSLSPNFRQILGSDLEAYHKVTSCSNLSLTDLRETLLTHDATTQVSR